MFGLKKLKEYLWGPPGGPTAASAGTEKYLKMVAGVDGFLRDIKEATQETTKEVPQAIPVAIIEVGECNIWCRNEAGYEDDKRYHVYTDTPITCPPEEHKTEDTYVTTILGAAPKVSCVDAYLSAVHIHDGTVYLVMYGGEIIPARAIMEHQEAVMEGRAGVELYVGDIRIQTPGLTSVEEPVIKDGKVLKRVGEAGDYLDDGLYTLLAYRGTGQLFNVPKTAVVYHGAYCEIPSPSRDAWGNLSRGPTRWTVSEVTLKDIEVR